MSLDKMSLVAISRTALDTISDLDNLINKLKDKTNKTNNPLPTDNFWIVRISQRKGAAAARFDYQKLVDDTLNDEVGVWDKDIKNKMGVGDWLGFIVGANGDERIELYYIKSERSIVERPSHWKSTYTDQQTHNDNKSREVIVFKKQPIISMLWSDWKRGAGYKESYMPRGTTRSKNPY